MSAFFKYLGNSEKMSVGEYADRIKFPPGKIVEVKDEKRAARLRKNNHFMECGRPGRPPKVSNGRSEDKG